MDFDFSYIDEDKSLQQKLWVLMSVGVIFNAFLNFAYLTWQVVPFAGKKGVYSVAKRFELMKKTFPLKTRLLHFPMQLLGFFPGAFSDSFLKMICYVGSLLTGAFMILEVNERLLGNSTIGFNIATGEGGNPLVQFLLGGGGGAGGSGIITIPAQLPLLWSIWILHACLADLMTLVFPWHSLISECLFVMPISYTITILSSSSSSGAAAGEPFYSTPMILQMRVLAFRCLFGFGKLKFVGARWQDWKYIKGFMPAIPVPTFGGLLIYRYAPDAAYLLAYAFFFISEMIIPFFLFSPWVSHRVLASGFSFKLMLGIIFSGNFGNFNTLVMAMSIGLSLPVQGHSTEMFTIPLFHEGAGLVPFLLAWVLKIHIVFGMMLLPFSTWVQSSWFGWTAVLTSGGPKVKAFCEFFEVLHAYRIVQPYGIFPPHTFAAQRQVPTFEGSNDGKTWKAYRFYAQASKAEHRPPMIPGIHPILDFTLMYTVAGATQSTMFTKNWDKNFETRPTESILTNLLEGGDVADCFAECPFPKASPPKYMRVVINVLMPATEGPNWWVETPGQVEIPPTSLEMLRNGGKFKEGTFPRVYNTDVLVDTEPGLRLWRERVVGRKEQIVKALGQQAASLSASNDEKAMALLRHLKEERATFPAEVRAFATDISKKCSTLAEVVRYCDRAGIHVGRRQHRETFYKLALFGADVLTTCGWPWVGEDKPRAEKLISERLEKYGPVNDGDGKVIPISSYQLFFFCLFLIADEDNLEKATAGGVEGGLRWAKDKLLALCEGPYSWYDTKSKTDPSQSHDGLKLYCALFPRMVRMEAALFRKFIITGQVGSTREEKGIDAILPGYQMYSRGIFQKEIPFWPATYEGIDDDLAKMVPNSSGSEWGKEIPHHFTWNPKKYEFEYQGILEDLSTLQE